MNQQLKRTLEELEGARKEFITEKGILFAIGRAMIMKYVGWSFQILTALK